MIRKNGKTLHQKEPLFRSSDYWVIYVVLSVSLVFRIFRFSFPPILTNQEKELLEDFKLFSKGKMPLDNKPISGRCLLYIPYAFIIKNQDERLHLWKYLRMINAIIGSIYPAAITASILLSKYNAFSAFTVGLILSLDGSSLVATKLYSTDSLLLLFVSLTILTGILSKRIKKTYITEIQSIFVVLACVTDNLGLIAFFYAIFTNNRNAKAIKSVVSMFLIFLTLELILKSQFSDEIKFEHSEDSFFQQIMATVQAIKLQFKPVGDFITAFYWPLCKLRPDPLWKNEEIDNAQRLVAVHNIPVIIVVFISCLLGILHKETIFFWMALVFTWAFKELHVMNYHVTLMLGAFCLAPVIEHFHEIMRSMMLITFIVVAFLFFSVFFPWIFAIEVDIQYDYTMNIWGMIFNQ